MTMANNPLFNTRTPLLNDGNPDQKRKEILDYFNKTFDLDEQLFEAFADQSALYRKADPLRHPLIFYYGHTATFYINKLIISKILTNRIDARFESMFAIGVDEMSWDDLNTSHYDWPTFEEVTAYRNKVRETVGELINNLPLNLPVNWENPFWIIMMGIEHERIHIETSSVLIRQIPLQYLQSISSWNICSEAAHAPVNSLIPVSQLKSGNQSMIRFMVGTTNMERIPQLSSHSKPPNTFVQMVSFCNLSKQEVTKLKNTGLKRDGTGKVLKKLNIRFSGRKRKPTGN
jgi:hypothetical protein